MTSSNLNSFNVLPNSIIFNIISYLPQNDKVNLLYTNYHFYCLVLPQLYKRLIFTRGCGFSFRGSFENNYTILGYSSNPLATEKLNEKILETRQKILLQSLEVNPELGKYIEHVVVNEDIGESCFHENSSKVVDLDLEHFLESKCSNIKRFEVFHNNQDRSLNLVLRPKMDCIDITDLNALDLALGYPIKELCFNAYNRSEPDINLEKVAEAFKHIDTLIFNEERSQTFVLSLLNSLFEKKQFNYLLKIKTLKIMHLDNWEDHRQLLHTFLDKVEPEYLENLDLTFGCDDITCHCMESFLDHLVTKKLNLKKLSFSHKTNQRDHNLMELFDFNLTAFLQKLPNNDKLRYLSIIHDTPPDFDIENGLEGNYLHRRVLYEKAFPLLTNLQILICPTFMQTLACYEQLVSNFLWNGCTCDHCSDYLPIFDEYILDHRYYNSMKARIVRMISPVFFGNLGNALSTRHLTDVGIFLDNYPLIDRIWDFHTSKSSISHINQNKECLINQSAFNAASRCAAHYLKEFVQTIHEMIPSLKNCVLSGISFNYTGESWESSD